MLTGPASTVGVSVNDASRHWRGIGHSLYRLRRSIPTTQKPDPTDVPQFTGNEPFVLCSVHPENPDLMDLPVGEQKQGPVIHDLCVASQTGLARFERVAAPGKIQVPADCRQAWRRW